MYQDIDDPEELEPPIDGRAGLSARSKRLFALILLAIILGVGFYIYQTHSRQIGQPANISQDSAISKIYRTAMAEPLAPLRRARLHDFVQTYPNSEYDRAAKAQLLILNDEEARSWSEVTDILYAPDSQRIDKLVALDRYERKWGPSFLGGRDDDIRTIKDNLENQTEATPSRKLEDNPDIAKPSPAIKPEENTIPDNILAGGPIIRPAPRRTVAPAIRPAIIPPNDVIVAPKVRRNSTPKFPRRAERRGVEGLVVLDLSIDAEGRVNIAKLVSVQAADYERDFVRAAQRAAKRTRFFPKTVNGVAQPAANIRKRYRFALN